MGEQLEPFVQHGTEEERLEVSADDILNAIAEKRDIDIKYAIIDGDLDIMMVSDRLEDGEDGMSSIEKSVRIEDSEILNNVDFSFITFNEQVSFLSSAFNGELSFSSVNFNEEVDFSSVTFKETVNFQLSNFNAKASFLSAAFHGPASFLSSVFSQAALFSKSVFDENANFWGTIFDDHVSFLFAVFSKTVLFWDTAFNETTDFNSTVLNKPASFTGATFRENTVFVGLWNDILCPTIQSITAGKANLTKKVVTDFSALDTATVMDGSSNPHLKRYIDDEQWIKSWREKNNRRRIIFFIWEITSHCGRSIGLWAAWSLFFILLFTLAYTPAPDWTPEWWQNFCQNHGPAFEQSVSAYQGKPMGFWSCFYFSIVSFTTLGYGDIAAANTPARFLVTVQVTFGYIMLGGLISIFANKFARRS